MPTVTFNVLFVFVVPAQDRRRVLHFSVTESPGAKWTAQQIVEAFPWDTAPRYLLRDRESIYGYEFTSRIENMGIIAFVILPAILVVGLLAIAFGALRQHRRRR